MPLYMDIHKTEGATAGVGLSARARPLIEPHRCQREPKASSNSESIAAQERRSAAAL